MHIYLCNGCGMYDCIVITQEDKEAPERCTQADGFESNWKEAEI